MGYSKMRSSRWCNLTDGFLGKRVTRGRQYSLNDWSTCWTVGREPLELWASGNHTPIGLWLSQQLFVATGRNGRETTNPRAVGSEVTYGKLMLIFTLQLSLLEKPPIPSRLAASVGGSNTSGWKTSKTSIRCIEHWMSTSNYKIRI